MKMWNSFRHFLTQRKCLTRSALGATALVVGLIYLDATNEERFQRSSDKYFGRIHASTLIDRQRLQDELNKKSTSPLPTRQEIKNSLNSDLFDVLVIGGGATGAGVALDSQTRGLRTALIELDDFSSGTSSRSTKLIHGGVRYLQAAVFGLDVEQYNMVKEALYERYNLLKSAPHLSHPLPILLPIYRLWQIPYYWAGLKAYDFVSGRRVLRNSYYISRSRALEIFPMLNDESLKGALVYYDGQHDDARMNIAIVLSAIRNGAKALNHAKVEGLLKDEDGRICGAHIKDMLTGETMNIKAKAVINATGPFTDSIRQMADNKVEPICQPSSGVHIILPGYYCSPDVGILDPSTSDGRVIFFLPWLGMTLAGTTDAPSAVITDPTPSEKDVDFILQEIKGFMSKNVKLDRSDVKSVWSGLRPLVRDPSKNDTKSLARNHIIEVMNDNLITIAGGKWTTYRHMAEETVDKAIKICKLKPRNECLTADLYLDGGYEWDPLLYLHLIQKFGLDNDIARHLSSTYGNHALEVAKLINSKYGSRRLHPEFPYLEAEVQHAVKEYASTAIDVIARRIRLAFLHADAANDVLERVVEIMGDELGWSKTKKNEEIENTRKFLDTQMGRALLKSKL